MNRKGAFLIALVIGLMFTLSSCGLNPAEEAIIGKWASNDSDMIFEFFENGTYHISNPNGLYKKEFAGRYHSRGSGYSKNLEEAEFVLVDGLDIKFNLAGDAFFINIDGSRGRDLFYRVVLEDKDDV